MMHFRLQGTCPTITAHYSVFEIIFQVNFSHSAIFYDVKGFEATLEQGATRRLLRWRCGRRARVSNRN